jgi:hypothetical protein
VREHHGIDLAVAAAPWDIDRGLERSMAGQGRPSSEAGGEAGLEGSTHCFKTCCERAKGRRSDPATSPSTACIEPSALVADRDVETSAAEAGPGVNKPTTCPWL